MIDSNIEKLLLMIEEGLTNTDFIKLTLSSKKDPGSTLKNVYVKVVTIKAGNRLSFVYRNPTQDITKNYSFEEGLEKIHQAIVNEFFQAVLLTAQHDVHLMQFPNGKSNLKINTASKSLKPVFLHDKSKKRYVSIENNSYLPLLGIVTADGKVRKGMEDKFRQINKYVEVVSHVVDQAGFSNSFTIADMGSGKGYLTFALYDYLTHHMKLSPIVTGVELRPELVVNCNEIAQKSNFPQLNFVEGSIEKCELPITNMLIALHACDTATDEAIYRGISQKAKVIITAPCCHKQIRKAINPENVLSEITKYGILEERQAEIITDTIRALVLESYGYTTKVFEFISTEHTPKNVLIVGTLKGDEQIMNLEKLDRIKQLKLLFGIQFHYLEKLLGINL